MTDYFRRQLFNVIAAVFLLLFVAVWIAVLFRVLTWIPEGDATAPSLNGALVTAAGVLATSLSSLTASALGFTISEVRRDRAAEPGPTQAAGAPTAGAQTSGSPTPRPQAAGAQAPGPLAPGEASYPSEVAERLSGRIIAAIMVYMVIGLLVLVIWLFKGTASTDLIGAFALSLLGWLVGAAGVVFQSEKPSQ
ncbi:hypothetical protein [Arthrobacter sp. NyZ413]|uniref:hypothetical protein n=1 Tax=Arthrobacter sp. NyZ413 TaxID=3144669 RepID=UPI002B534E0C|nr:hypothetical protein [Arthrobacter sp.]